MKNSLKIYMYFLCTCKKINVGFPTLIVYLVPVVGLEPTRPGGQQILSLSRLPVPTHRHNYLPIYYITIYAWCKLNFDFISLYIGESYIFIAHIPIIIPNTAPARTSVGKWT